METMMDVFKEECLNCRHVRKMPQFLRKTNGDYIFLCLNSQCMYSSAFTIRDPLTFSKEEALEYVKKMDSK